jgi:hypothetical protein
MVYIRACVVNKKGILVRSNELQNSRFHMRTTNYSAIFDRVGVRDIGLRSLLNSSMVLFLGNGMIKQKLQE